MRIRKSKNTLLDFVIIIAILSQLLSCNEKYHNIELPEFEPKLVVNSFITEGEIIKINLTSNLSRTSTANFIPVKNASINLFENNLWVEELTPVSDSLIMGDEIYKFYYVSKNTIPKAGCTYRIEVTAPGLNPISAQSIIPPKAKIWVVDTAWIKVDWDIFLKTGVKIETLPDKYSFFLACAHLQPVFEETGSLYNPLIGYKKKYFTFCVNDPFIGKREGRYNEEFLIFSNDIIPTLEYTFSIEINKLQTETYQQIAVDLVTLSNDALKYLTTLADHNKNDIRYSEPAKIYSNVVGGQGIFAGINIACDTIILHR